MKVLLFLLRTRQDPNSKVWPEDGHPDGLEFSGKCCLNGITQEDERLPAGEGVPPELDETASLGLRNLH